ncbi:MAG: trehalose-6-phosphate synthase [Actinomycetota bacterium]|nr:trehalose-6-phosphate synthase [Actinomycetota bacterium]
MNDDLSVVLASNRGPISFVRKGEEFGIKRGAGGLAGALDPVVRKLGDKGIWIAAATSETDREALVAGAADGLAQKLGYPVYFLDIDPDTYADYYDVVSNRMLWFANHCLWDELGVREFGRQEKLAWQEAYEPVNRRFSKAVLEVADPDSLVLFQDYHLTTAPGYLRESRPSQTIFHFTHSSFCGPNGLERLPAPIPKKVIEGMLGADLLGFHVPAWSKGFMDCCERIGATVDPEAGTVDFDGRRSWIRSYPIPIDAPGLIKRSKRKKAREWADRFRSLTDGPLIVRADRSEPSKNVLRGFEAFARTLERRPDLRGRTRFVACLYPSRETMPEYQIYSEKIDRIVAEVNERYPDSIHLFMKDDFDRTLGALLVYDVLVVNSIMDGMNLVSKEGPAINENIGALVLSKGAGSFTELGQNAITIVDPLDVEETSKALEAAIEMSPSERRTRADRLRDIVHSTKPGDWIQSQIEDLALIQAEGRPKASFTRVS